mgnify:CR=1 FL=1
MASIRPAPLLLLGAKLICSFILAGRGYGEAILDLMGKG